MLLTCCWPFADAWGMQRPHCQGGQAVEGVGSLIRGGCHQSPRREGNIVWKMPAQWDLLECWGPPKRQGTDWGPDPFWAGAAVRAAAME